MNRTRKADNLDAKFQLRLRKKDLAKYKAKAAGLGLSLSEMILSALDGVPVRDR